MNNPLKINLLRQCSPILPAIAALIIFSPGAHSHDSEPHEAIAKQMTAQNAALFQIGGMDSTGGINDWVISNGTLCAVISDVSHEDELSSTGGAITDISLCNNDNDFFLTNRDFINGGSNGVVHHSIVASSNQTTASLTLQGSVDGVAVETTYAVDVGKPHQLEIQKKFRITAKDTEISYLFPIALDSGSMRSFVASVENPSHSTGEKTAEFTNASPTDIADFSYAGDLIIFESRAKRTPDSLVLGWQMKDATLSRADGEIESLSYFSVVDHTAFGFIIFGEPFFIEPSGGLSWLQLPEAPFLKAEMGEEITLTEAYTVAAGGVSTLLNQYYPEAPLLTGRVDDPGATIYLNHKDGSPFSRAYPNEEGEFHFRAPKGNYVLKAIGEGNRQAQKKVDTKTSAVDAGLLALGRPTQLVLPRGQIMRLTIIGKNMDGTLNPNDRKIVHLAGVESDPTELIVAPGAYRIFASRGLSYTATKTDISLQKAETRTITIDSPVPAFALDGLQSTDTHVHSGVSLDSYIFPEDRVRSYVAEGLDILVSTEHDTLFDFQPIVDALSVNDEITVITGAEVTSEVASELTPYTIGHAAAFPLVLKPLEYRKGMVAHEGRRWRDVIADIKRTNPQAVLQLNHAQASAEEGENLAQVKKNLGREVQGTFLTHMGVAQKMYDASQAITSDHNNEIFEPDPHTGIRDMDFDAIEIMNGSDMNKYRALQRDWFSLIRQGFILTATAASDTHGSESSAIPRSYITLAANNDTGFDQDTYSNAMIAGKLIGTSGPVPLVSMQGKGPGNLVSGSKNSLEIDILHASWVPAEKITVYVNGEIQFEQNLQGENTLSIPMTFSKDSFVVVEISGETNETYRLIHPDFTPLAFTNPIYIDANSDGHWEAPGL